MATEQLYIISKMTLPTLSSDKMSIDDDDDTDIIAAMRKRHFLCYAFAQTLDGKQTRVKNWHRKRSVPHELYALSNKDFQCRYRLSFRAFYFLLGKIRGRLLAGRGGRGGNDIEPIHPALKLAIALRLMAGSRAVDVEDLHGVAKVTIYKIFHEVVNAINQTIAFPNVSGSLQEVEAGFRSLSSGQVIRGCVGAIDGIHIKIQRPSRERDNVQNAKKYHVSRKNCYAWNVQAVCDYRRRFLFADVRYPGSTGDHLAFRGSRFYDTLEQLPRPYFIVGDAAYAVQPWCMTPFKGCKSEWVCLRRKL